MSIVLRTDPMTMKFGGVTAVNNLQLDIEEGKIVALIGPNGAGKTTAFNMITGVYKPTKGNVFFTDAAGKETNITGKKPREYDGINGASSTPGSCFYQATNGFFTPSMQNLFGGFIRF